MLGDQMATHELYQSTVTALLFPGSERGKSANREPYRSTELEHSLLSLWGGVI